MTTSRTLARLPRTALACAWIVFAGMAGTACSKAASTAGPGASSSAHGGPPGGPGAQIELRFPVEVAPVEAKPVQYALSAVGSVEAYERVQVTARVAGVVEQVRFREGETVAQDQVLIEIDPRRYRVAVASARATRERAEAGKLDAETSLGRREAAVAQSPGLIPADEIESSRTGQRVALAEVAQADAALAQAALNLKDAYVRAPIAGTIEIRSVDTGQYVQPGAVLAILVRRDPLLLRFQAPESEAANLATGMHATFRARSDANEHTATITHVAQTADTTSRMVQVVAEVDATSREGLRPGAFAEVNVPIGNHAVAPVIPALAIRPSERGFLAFVVVGEAAEERVLTLGMRTAEGLVEIRSGLRAGESLVVRGAEALRAGAKVRVVPAGASAAPAAPSPTPAAPAGKPP